MHDSPEITQEETFDKWETKTISWQEKIFSKSETDFYLDQSNCLTDLEKKYHKAVAKLQGDNGIIFTYVSEDDYNYERESVSRSVSYLQAAFDKINLADEDLIESDNGEDNEQFDYEKSLISSLKNPLIDNCCEKMYVMADVGEYIDNTWIKYEILLGTITYHKKRNTLTVYPDFSNNIPYCFQIAGDSPRCLYFTLENASEEIPEDIVMAEGELFRKITKQKCELKKEALGNFDLPPKNKLLVYIFFEIASAKNFEYDDIYVQYFIDLPDYWTCKNPEMLNGMTQTSQVKGEDGLAHFGYIFEIALEYNIHNLQTNRGIPKAPYIYFEVISRDSWDRYRTEGLAYKCIPVSSPGYHSCDMQCFRLCSGTVYGNLKRFFIGDCSNYNDITWIGIPKDHQNPVLNKFGVNTIGTGELKVRMNVIHQSQAFLPEYRESEGGKLPERLIFEKLSASSLVKSVEQVLHAFRKARKNMLEARKDL